MYIYIVYTFIDATPDLLEARDQAVQPGTARPLSSVTPPSTHPRAVQIRIHSQVHSLRYRNDIGTRCTYVNNVFMQTFT